MELKPKYQYTYFIKPFIVQKANYKKYLIKLLKDKKLSLKIWERERDLDIYRYFLPELRNQIFLGMNNEKENIEQLKAMKHEKQASWLAKQFCVQFQYQLKEDAPGKIGEENGIFFGINSIQIICFNTGVCFLLLKTYLEDAEKFSNILDFNYKFKEFGSISEGLKEFEKINIQTNSFHNGKELKQVIEKLIGTQEEHISISNDNFYVYSYTCVDAQNWNDQSTFDGLKTEFWKYCNVQPSSYNADIENIMEEEGRIAQWEYARFGINKNSAVLLTSSLNSYHYTNLPFEYENQYLYTYLIALYQKLYLKKLMQDFKSGKKVDKTRENLNKFIQNIWMKEITEEKVGTIFYQKCQKELDIENIYLETMNIYEVAWKENKRTKVKKIDKIILAILGISLAMNVINAVILLNII